MLSDTKFARFCTHTFFIYTVFDLLNVNAPISAQLVAILDGIAISTCFLVSPLVLFKK